MSDKTRETPRVDDQVVDYCEVCERKTAFRSHLGGPWFCTICGTRDDEVSPNSPEEAGVAAAAGGGDVAGASYPPERARRGRPRGWVLPLAIIVAAAAAFLTASADTSAQCGPFYAPCSITVNNHGVWPERIDANSVVVDGTPVQTSGSGIAWPFGSASVTLYDAAGTGLHTMKHVQFSVGPALLPPTAQDMTMGSASGPDATPTDTAGTAGSSASDTPAPSPTPNPADLQQGDVHVCLFTHYDAGAVNCISDDSAVPLTGMDKAQITWPPSKGGSPAATIQVLQKDGTGTWQVVASASPDPSAAVGSDGANASETVQTLFYPSGANVNTACNAAYMIRVVNADNHQFGQAPLVTSC